MRSAGGFFLLSLSPLRTILQLLCLHKCQHQALSALSAIVARSPNPVCPNLYSIFRIPYTVYRIPYTVFRIPSTVFYIPYAHPSHSSLNIIISHDFLLVCFLLFLIYQLSANKLTFVNTGHIVSASVTRHSTVECFKLLFQFYVA